MMADFITAAASQDDFRNHTWDLVNKAEDYQIRKWEDERHFGYSTELQKQADDLYDENELQKFKNVEDFYARNRFSPLAMLGQSFSASPAMGGSFSPSTANPQHSDSSETGRNALAIRLQNHQFKVMEKQENLLDEQAITEQTKQQDNRAAANLKDVEASDKEIDVRRKMNEDSAINTNFVRFYESKRDNAKTPEEKAMYQKRLDDAGEYTSGALKGVQAFTDYEFKLLQQDLERQIIEAKKRENVPDTIAKIPATELAERLMKIAKLNAEIASLAQSRQLDEAKINEIEAKIKVLEREEQSIYHNDPVAMYNADNGDWSTYMLTNGIRDVVHGVGQGVGYGGAAAVTRRLDPSAPKDLKNLHDKSKTTSSTSSLPSQSAKQRNERIRKSVEQREQKRREHQRKGSEIRKRMNSPIPDFYYAQ